VYRTQLLLEEWQYQTLRSRAEQGGASISSLVREAVDRYLKDSRPGERGSLDEMRGIGHDSGLAGRDHDLALYDNRSAPGRTARARKQKPG
jgi:hypothetical protein